MSYGPIPQEWKKCDKAIQQYNSNLSGQIILKGEPYWYMEVGQFTFRCREEELPDAKQFIFVIPLADVSQLVHNAEHKDCTDEELEYTGSWTLVDDDFDSNNGTHKYSNTLDDKAEIEYYGIGARIRFKRDSGCGLVTITLGTKTITVDTNNDTTDHRYFSIMEETIAKRTLEIKVAQAGATVKIDSITLLTFEKALDTVSIIQEIINARIEIIKAFGDSSKLKVMEQYPALYEYILDPPDRDNNLATTGLANKKMIPYNIIYGMGKHWDAETVEVMLDYLETTKKLFKSGQYGSENILMKQEATYGRLRPMPQALEEIDYSYTRDADGYITSFTATDALSSKVATYTVTRDGNNRITAINKGIA